MNWAQFEDPLYYLCLAGTVVTYWSLTQEVAGSNNLLKRILFFVTEFSNSVKTLRETQMITINNELNYSLLAGQSDILLAIYTRHLELL